jgi:endonuclease VIII
MPEGDAVWRTARHLHVGLSGRTLVRTDFRVPAIATADFSGGTVVETVSRGKHLLTRIDARPIGGEQWTLHTHLKMEGSWRVYDRGQRWTKAGPLARVVIDTGNKVGVGFQLGIVELVLREHEDQVVGHLGPDLLGPDWDEHEAVRRLTADARPRGEALLDQRNLAGVGIDVATPRTIGEALLDQRCLAGMGTIYRSETLFLTGVSPFLQVTAVPVPKVVNLARRLMLANRDHPQITTTGVARRGEQLWVYGRAGQPCRRCGTTIQRAMQGPPPYDRVTYWCRSCQPARAGS